MRASDQEALDRTAIVLDGDAISYRSFDADIDAAVVLLRRAGLGPDSRIAIHFGSVAHQHPYENWVAHRAAMRLGAVHATIVDAAGMAVVADRLDAIVGTPVDGWSLPLVAITRAALGQAGADPAPDDRATAPDPSRAARLNLTSGTTGGAKLVRWDAAMIAARVAQAAQADFIGPETALYSLFNPRVTAGFRYPLAVWAAGGRVLMQTQVASGPAATPLIDQATLFVCSPIQLERALGIKPGVWPGRDRRLILTVGGRVPTAVRDQALANAGYQLLIGYGSTETGNVATGDTRLADRHPGAVGAIRNGVTVEIVDVADTPLARGASGRVRIKSPIMCNVYDNAPAETGRTGFRDGWFYPGDLGVIMPDGTLAIDGREGDVANFAGVKLPIATIEDKVRALPEVVDACACVLRLDDGDRLVFAVVCDEPAFGAMPDRIGDALAPFHYPFLVTRLARIPRNDMGKVPRLRLAREIARHYVKP